MRRLVVVALLAAAAVIGKVAWTGWSQWEAGIEAEGRADHHEAALRYGRVLHMYLPGSPLADRASQRLLDLADAATDRDQQRYCLEELRSGWLSVRGLWQPGQPWIDAAEFRLTGILTEDPRGNWPDRALPHEGRRAVVAAVLTERDDPILGWVLVMEAGFILWMAATARGFWLALPEEQGQPIAWGRLGRHLSVAALGYGLWLLGVARA